MKAGIVSNLTANEATASLAVAGSYSPDNDCEVSGVVTISFTAAVTGDHQVEGRLRNAERCVAATILDRLRAYDAVVTQRDALLAEKRVHDARLRSTSGFRTGEVMLDEAGRTL